MVTLTSKIYTVWYVNIWDVLSNSKRRMYRKLMPGKGNVYHRLLNLHHRDLPDPRFQSWSALFCLSAILVWCSLLGRIKRQVALQLPFLTTLMRQESHFNFNLFIWQGKLEPKRTQTCDYTYRLLRTSTISCISPWESSMWILTGLR